MAEVPDAVIDTEFPVWGLLPKKETGVVSFLNKYPSYDGRGTIIAILDTGVDPGAPGLQKTSDGKTKVIHRFDCSGCGDVNTSTVVEEVNGKIIGLTGCELKIPSEWKNPSKVYRIGVKHAYDLYPERLKERMKSNYKEKMWDEYHKKIVADANRDLTDYEAKHTGSNLSEVERLSKEDFESKIEVFANYDKKFTDVGPVYDCVLFHNGEYWCCCIDTTETGNLESCPILGEYSITHQYSPLTPLDNLNFTMNVHNDGNVLELVGLCSSHGTHVAAIAAANFPDNPDQNGVAPGAQIVSLTIGDGRLNTMETGTALVRAMIKVIELSKTQQIHVINTSYGEHAHWSDTGRIGELMNEIVNKYGVVWVAAAGNHGPALNTVNTPPDISQETIIGVGAYVSPEMMVAEYSMRQKLPGMPYTWTSRGPTIDGGLGVSVCAPGAAITSVGNFTLRYSQLLNGTSMASPHLAGAVNVLISGLKQQNLGYSPYSIKRAIETSANFIQGVEIFAQGYGLFQIERTFEHLVKYNDAQERNVRFHVTCGSSSKGVFIRSKSPLSSHSYNITIDPVFLNPDEVSVEEKMNFNMKLVLSCNASFVSYPSHLDLSHVARVFAIKVDTSGLQTGVHFGSISAYDVNNIPKGPLFQIPVTVIIPQDVSTPKYQASFSRVFFKPNTIKRHFFHVPNLATWGVLRLSSNDVDGIGRFIVHCMQILPRQSCKVLELNKAVTVTANNDSVINFQVRAGLTLEVVIAKYWANIGDVELDYSISFYGIKPLHPAITMHSAEGIQTLEVTTLQGEEIAPSITLKNSVQIVRPSEAKVLALTARDLIPPSRQIYELVLVYNFSITKSTEVSPAFSLLCDVLYESEFESQMWLLYDANKQLLGCGDAYPSKYSVKLEKGDYVIRLQVRHDRKDYLDKMNESPLLLQQKLSSTINLDVYGNYSQALIGGKKASVSHGLYSTSAVFYVSPLPSDKYQPKNQNPAQYLTGYITYSKDELGKKVDTYPIKYILTEPGTKKSNNSTDKDKTKMEEYLETLRDLKIQWLPKLDIANAEKHYDELKKEYPDNLQVHSAYLQLIDPLDPKHALPVLQAKENLPFTICDINKVINICSNIIDKVNEETLLAYFALKTDLRPDANKIKSTMEQQKNIYIDAICRKGIAYCRGRLLQSDSKIFTLEEINNLYKSLVKFVDPNDSKVTSTNILFFAMWHANTCKYYGKLLKYLIKLQEDKAIKETEEKIIELCVVNNWTHIEKHLRRLLPSKFPTAYKPF